MHFGQVSHSAANSNDGDGTLWKPWDALQFLPDEVLHFFLLGRSDGIGAAEEFCEVDSPHGNTDGVNPFFALYQGDFHAGAAQIKEKEIILVDGVDHAGESEPRFFSAADDRQGNTRGSSYLLQKR